LKGNSSVLESEIDCETSLAQVKLFKTFLNNNWLTFNFHRTRCPGIPAEYHQSNIWLLWLNKVSLCHCREIYSPP
jgi:hypothetical protein